jgi:predicted nucleic acid-binding protein
MLLIDTSAIVKFFSKEPGWEGTAKHVANSLTIPLAAVELGSALLKKARKNEIAQDTAIELLNGYLESAIFVDQNKHLGTAVRIAIKADLAIYDSLFIATALNEGYELASCDEKQIKVANGLGIKTIGC